MPIYEFKCEKCGSIFEYLCFKSGDLDASCPSCGGENTERLLSAFSSFSNSCGKGCGDASSSTECAPSSGFS